jgi:acetyltransferase-like isoleucine patch superfamily enzyme
VVQRDFPEKTLCMGNPARVVFRDYDNSQILRNVE